MITTPPYPDYTSGLNAVIGAAPGRFLGARQPQIDLNITSAAAGVTRHYERRAINGDAIDARVWSGIHFRTADVVGNHGQAGGRLGAGPLLPARDVDQHIV